MTSLLRSVVIAVVLGWIAATPASAQPAPEPSGAHPRLLLDATLIKAWQAAARQPGNPVARAIRRCDQVGAARQEFDRDGYMGLDWAHLLQACLVAYVATGKDPYAVTTMRYFTAMLDDLGTVGDGKGGDEAARRDSGYALRAMGPYPALVYDWLHDHKLMTEALRQRARQRFAAWTDWYRIKGYRARGPATNYQAGYLMAATFIAIAQGGEAGEAGHRLWRHVVDDLWRTDMTKAFAPGGVLDGGDWAEGWQYGPLSVAEYAVSMRVMRRHGVELAAARTWPIDLLRRYVHALAPSDRLFVGGDTQTEQPYLEPYMFGLAAIALSDAAPLEIRGQAVAEMDRLGFDGNEFLLFDALARGVGLKPVQVARATWPTWYVARGTSTLYTRTRWDADAIWMVMQCSRTLDVDHFQPNAGNFVISRGRDNLIVDPSPYGSLSTLTGNAPTVDSPQLPPNYLPSQGYWGELTGFRWAHQTARGVVTARCDYADQYKFQARPSDTPMAVRDFVLVPDRNGSEAALVISDRADTTSRSRELHLRFRSGAPWTMRGESARLEVGQSQAQLTTYGAGPRKPTISSPSLRDCFKDTVTRGNCDAARFPVVDYRLQLPGPKVQATHVILVSPRGAPARRTEALSEAIRGDNYQGVAIPRARGEAAVLWAQAPTGLTYRTRPGATVVVHDAVPVDRVAATASRRVGDGCVLTVGADGPLAGPASASRIAAPLVLFVDDQCQLTIDELATGGNAATGPVERTGATSPAAPPAAAPSAAAPAAAAPDAASSPGADVTRPPAPRSPRSGCYGASVTPGSTLATALLLGLALALQRRRDRGKDKARRPRRGR